MWSVSDAEEEPDPRPLGYLALGAATLTALLALSYFLSPLAFLTGALTLFLGGAARGISSTREAGTVAMGVALVAMAYAAFILVTTL